jgi:phage I-like protein
LWAIVDWTNSGRQVLSDKEFRYLSPEFTLNYRDNETLKEHGPTLLGAGLTNRPVIKGMAAAVELHEGEKMELKELQDKNVKLSEEVKTLSEKVEALEGEKKAFADAFSGMSVDQLKAMMEELKAKIASLEGDQQKVAEEKALSEKIAKFDDMLTAGKVVEAQREAYMSDDVAKFAELAGDVKLSENGNATVPAKSGDAQDKILEIATKLFAEKNAKDFGSAISMA